MNFDFSDEQKQFREQIRRALNDVCPLKEVRRVFESDAHSSQATMAALVELGVTGAAIPEQYGGLGLGYYELCIAAEESGRALAPIPLTSTIFLVSEVLLLAGTERQKLEWLPKLASGAVTAAFCDCTVKGGAPRFVDDRLEGVCGPASDAVNAAFAIVLGAEADGAPSLFLVPLDQDSVRLRTLESVDPARKLSELTLTGARAERCGAAGAASEIITMVKRRAAVLVAFEQLGGADRALEMARDYALERKAFGRPVGGFQAIKHKLANAYIKNEVARAHAYYGAWALSNDSTDLPLAAAAARISATEAFGFIAQENIQVHGGIGFTWESDCQLFYRRARHLALQLGNVLDWKERAMSAIEQSNAA